MNRQEKTRKVVEAARKYLEVPYKRNAKFYEAPHFFNCSTFTRFVYEKIGKDLPKKAITQSMQGRKVKAKNIKIGDLVFIRGNRGYYNSQFPDGIGHVGIYVGENKIISARGRYKKVTEEKLKNYLKKEQFRVIKRFL